MLASPCSSTRMSKNCAFALTMMYIGTKWRCWWSTLALYPHGFTTLWISLSFLQRCTWPFLCLYHSLGLFWTGCRLSVGDLEACYFLTATLLLVIFFASSCSFIHLRMYLVFLFLFVPDEGFTGFKAFGSPEPWYSGNTFKPLLFTMPRGLYCVYCTE